LKVSAEVAITEESSVYRINPRYVLTHDSGSADVELQRVAYFANSVEITVKRRPGAKSDSRCQVNRKYVPISGLTGCRSIDYVFYTFERGRNQAAWVYRRNFTYMTEI